MMAVSLDHGTDAGAILGVVRDLILGNAGEVTVSSMAAQAERVVLDLGRYRQVSVHDTFHDLRVIRSGGHCIVALDAANLMILVGGFRRFVELGILNGVNPGFSLGPPTHRHTE